MANKDFRYIHWVPAKKPRPDFPLTYDISSTSEYDNQESAAEAFNSDKYDDYIKQKVEYTVSKEQSFKEAIKENFVHKFNFDKYMDPFSDSYIGQENNLKAVVLVDVYNVESQLTKTNKEKLVRVYKMSALIELANFNTNYGYTLVKSLEQLESILKSNNIEKIAFDTETTGLNPEVDNIVGLSFSYNKTHGYYVPVAHDERFAEQNLGEKALDLIYEALAKADISYFFNARFDARMMEYSPKKYDMLKVNMVDAQVTCYFADPEFRKHDLKYLEKHFCGFYRPNLEETLRGSDLTTFNLALINPKNLLFYAGQDAISTFCVGEETYKFLEEFKLSGQIDMMFLPRLMRMENHAIRVDMKLLEEELALIEPRIKELQEKLHGLIGDINLSSPKQKIALFESYGLDTGEKTETGNMATGQKYVDAMIERMEEQEKEIPEFLQYLGELSKLEKLKSTFFGSLLEQAKINNGRVRINYRNTVAATGRLSSGEEKED